MITTRVLAQSEVAAVLDDVAALRIKVFRAFPYLYDGDLAYERRYLQPYVSSENAVLVAAYEGDRLIGAATATPLEDHASAFGAALADIGPDPRDIFYCAESVLLPAYRGQGIGHRFFDLREQEARAHGFAYCAFCAVIRPQGHALQPEGYASLEPFWHKRGYAKVPGAVAQFEWKDIDQTGRTPKPLQFWMRAL